jgi:hypothetical protein
MTEQELQQHLNDIQLWYLQGTDKDGWNILVYKIENEGIFHHDKVRELMCQFGPEYAYHYAFYLDKCPSDDTRSAILNSSGYSYAYAKYIDKCPRDDTRNAACNDPFWAYCYAKHIDRCSRDNTRNASYKEPEYRQKYIEIFGK